MGNDCLYGKADSKGLQRPDPARQANLWQSLEMTVKTGQFFTGAEKSLNSSLAWMPPVLDIERLTYELSRSLNFEL